MRLRHLASAAFLSVFAAGCSTDDILNVEPETVVEASNAITSAVAARSAVAGLYDALQSGDYYGVDFVALPEISSDNAFHSGTFSTYRTADVNQLASDNSDIAGIWRAIYASINRANVLITQLPTATFFIDPDEKSQMMAEAYLVRALGYHNLVRLFGGVPIRTTPVSEPRQAENPVRASEAEVYQRIHADLDSAQAAMRSETQSRQGSLGAVHALRARVYLYQADYARALAAAEPVEALGYELASNYSDLFDTRGSETPEDIFRVAFSDQDAGALSYYYMAKALGGRRELAPTTSIRAAYDTADARFKWNIGRVGSTVFASKYPSVSGTDHIHVIRYGEVLLIKAEALARLNRLPEAVAAYNQLRVRAGLTPHSFGVHVVSQQQVIDAILRERRLELAFEGDRWTDMRRTGEVLAFLEASGRASTQALYPIPRREIDVAPTTLEQNPGY